MILGLTVSLMAFPHSVQAQPGPDIEVRPDVGPPGALFFFFATGFDGDDDKEEVSVWINRPDGSTTTDNMYGLHEVTDTGRIDWRWEAPSDAPPGTWSAVAYGNESDVERVVTFEVRRGAAPAPSDPDRLETNVQPNAGPAGTRFAFYATGFGNEEDISVWLNTPAGQVIAADDTNVSKLNESVPGGRADWYWTSPPDAMPGTWSVVAHGQESNVEHVILFEIVP
ncbi:MAG: hypothetical protein HC837_11620 [Chloroflexaceae bacterium]|nr:hypothetical protein [Chloroflexaceae bacterium]